jgi:hypothetical protein
MGDNRALLADNPHLQGNAVRAHARAEARRHVRRDRAHEEAYRRAQEDALKSRASGSFEDLMKAANVIPATVRAAEQGGHQAGHDDQMANRGLELWHERNALQGNPYLQMGGP